MTPPVTPHRVPIPEAARVLGVSIPTVKRRLKRGELAGERERTPSGFKWLVLLPLAEGAESPPPESPGPPTGESPAAPRESPVSPLVTQRAQEMAAYTRQLLEPLHARLEAQAERIGRLEEQLERATAELAESRAQLAEARTAAQSYAPAVGAPETNEGAAAQSYARRRPWWRWWRWWG